MPFLVNYSVLTYISWLFYTEAGSCEIFIYDIYMYNENIVFDLFDSSQISGRRFSDNLVLLKLFPHVVLFWINKRRRALVINFVKINRSLVLFAGTLVFDSTDHFDIIVFLTCSVYVPDQQQVSDPWWSSVLTVRYESTVGHTLQDMLHSMIWQSSQGWLKYYLYMKSDDFFVTKKHSEQLHPV